MSTCKTASGPPRTFLKIESSKFNTMFLTTSPWKLTEDLSKFCLTLRKSTLKWTQVVENGQNRYFCGKLNNFFFRPARELIFSLKYFYLDLLTGKYHSRPGKNLYVEKNDLKLTKNRFFTQGILSTSRKSHFSTINTRNNCNKVNNAKNYVKYRV